MTDTGRAEATAPQSRGPSRWRNGLLLGLSSLVGLGLCEAALHLAGYSYSPLSIQVGDDPSDRRQFHAFEDDHFEFDPDLIWAPRKGYGIFNADGLRGPWVRSPKPVGEFRILAVGDSNTLGWRGPDGPNWPAYVGEELRPLGGRLKVINAGVWGYSSYQGLIRLRRCLALEPDLVLVSFGATDALAVAVSDHDYQAKSNTQSGSMRALLRFRLGQLYLALLDRVGGGDGAPRPATTRRVPLADYRDNLTQMIRLVREQQAAVVLLTRPYVGEAGLPQWWKRLGADYNAATVEVGAREGVPVIDLYTRFKDAPHLFADESHFTEEGHRRAAGIVRRALLPMLPSTPQ